MVGLVRSWKQSVLPTQLYLFHMASDRSFAKMCKEQHPLVCQRWRRYIGYLLGGVTVPCLRSYLLRPLVVMAQSWFAAKLLSFLVDPFNFISSAFQDKALIMVWILKKKVAVSLLCHISLTTFSSPMVSHPITLVKNLHLVILHIYLQQLTAGGTWLMSCVWIFVAFYLEFLWFGSSENISFGF